MSNKTNIYIVNLKKTLRQKPEIQEEMLQYGKMKSIKVRQERYDYEINEAMVRYTIQTEAEEAISQINKGTVWHAEIYQNRYIVLNKGRTKKTKENNDNGEGKRNETNNERQNHQSRKGIDKWPEEMDILKSGVSQIKNYTQTVLDNKE